MRTKYIIDFISLIVMSILLGVAFTRQSIETRAYYNYYIATENYLDEIEEECDIASGSDTHCEYVEYRKQLQKYLK